MNLTVIVVLLVVGSHRAFAESLTKTEVDGPQYWEYGVGFGYVQYELYPASRESAHLFLPFPTFQYRGEVLRADDREGAHAYLYKSENWNVEISGVGFPEVRSSNSDDRQGMSDIPWMLGLGPEIVYRGWQPVTLALGIFQAISTNFQVTKATGAIYRLRLSHKWYELIGPDQTQQGSIHLSFNGGNAEFLGNYFEVNAAEATATRPFYQARSGLLGTELSAIETFKRGRSSFYFGAAINDYTQSVNRQSSLHRSDRNTSFFVGLTYVLGESARQEVREEDTSGIINRWHRTDQRLE